MNVSSTSSPDHLHSVGFFGLAIPIDFILQHSPLLMVVLGGLLVIVICLLLGLLFNHR